MNCKHNLIIQNKLPSFSKRAEVFNLVGKVKNRRRKPIMKETFEVLTPLEKPEDMNTLMPSQPYLVQVVNPSKNIYETNSIRGLVTAVMGEVLKDDYARCEDLQEEELARIEVARILCLMKLRKSVSIIVQNLNARILGSP